MIEAHKCRRGAGIDFETATLMVDDSSVVAKSSASRSVIQTRTDDGTLRTGHQELSLVSGQFVQMFGLTGYQAN